MTFLCTEGTAGCEGKCSTERVGRSGQETSGWTESETGKGWRRAAGNGAEDGPSARLQVNNAQCSGFMVLWSLRTCFCWRSFSFYPHWLIQRHNHGCKVGGLGVGYSRRVLSTEL